MSLYKFKFRLNTVCVCVFQSSWIFFVWCDFLYCCKLLLTHSLSLSHSLACSKKQNQFSILFVYLYKAIWNTKWLFRQLPSSCYCCWCCCEYEWKEWFSLVFLTYNTDRESEWEWDTPFGLETAHRPHHHHHQSLNQTKSGSPNPPKLSISC